MTPKRLAAPAFVPVVRRRTASYAGRDVRPHAYLLATASTFSFSRAIFSIVHRAPPAIRQLPLHDRT
jgi:hypothetical protein